MLNATTSSRNSDEDEDATFPPSNSFYCKERGHSLRYGKSNSTPRVTCKG